GATAPPIADVHASVTMAARRLRIRASLQGGRALGLIGSGARRVNTAQADIAREFAPIGLGSRREEGQPMTMMSRRDLFRVAGGSLATREVVVPAARQPMPTPE